MWLIETRPSCCSPTSPLPDPPGGIYIKYYATSKPCYRLFSRDVPLRMTSKGVLEY